MKEFKNVRGSMKNVAIIEVGIDTVYVRSNVVSINEEDFAGWQYDEIQYGKDEYIELIAQNTKTLEEENMSNMLASIENYEKNLQLEEENNNTMVALTEMFEMLGGL